MTIQTKPLTDFKPIRNTKHKELNAALLALGPDEAVFVQGTEQEYKLLPPMVSRIGKKLGVKFSIRRGEYQDEQGVVIYRV